MTTDSRLAILLVVRFLENLTNYHFTNVQTLPFSCKLVHLFSFHFTLVTNYGDSVTLTILFLTQEMPSSSHN